MMGHITAEMNSSESLIAFAETRSQAAFAEVVRQNIDLVYGAALRQVRSAHLADDVTQAVFIILSKKARTITNPAALPAWLIRTTHYAACNALRYEKRRRFHE